jgi:pimeloyl-ACP methyl ester carboxylesterase
VRRDSLEEGGTLDRPIGRIQFEHVGYGYSDPVEGKEVVDLSGTAICHATHELLCLLLNSSTSTSTSTSSTHPPIIAWGGSYGGLLAQLYRFLYPSEVCGLLLVDPSPTSIFDAVDAPMGAQMNKAADIYDTTAAMASVGFIRPMQSLMRFSSGEVKEAMAILPPEYVSQIFSAKHLRNMGREFRGFKRACQQLDEEYAKQREPTATPLILISACSFSQLYGGRTAEQTSEWWKESQKPYLTSSTRSVHDVQEKTHVQVGTDGTLQGQQLKALIRMTVQGEGERDQ